jgi:hypothetical protein
MVRLGVTAFPVVEFFNAFEYIRSQAFKPEIVRSAFERIGIYLIDVFKVVAPLRAQMAVTARLLSDPISAPLSSPPFIVSEIEYITPHKIAEIDALGIHIHGLMMQQNVNPAIIIVFEKMRKGSIIGLHIGSQAEEQFYEMEAAKRAREI